MATSDEIQSVYARLEEARRSLDATQLELLQTETSYRALVECAPDAILVQDWRTGLFIDANDAARDLFGYEVSELERFTPRHLYAPEDRQQCTATEAELRATGTSRRSGVRMLRKSGRTFRADITVNAYESRGRCQTVCIVRDVTESFEREQELRFSNAALRAAQQELEASELAYRALVDAASDAILLIDWESALIVEANSAACEMFGFTLNEWRAMKGRDLNLVEDYPVVDGINDELRATGRARRQNQRLLTKSGDVRRFDMTLSVYTVGGRKLMVSVVRDVTRRYERERELERSYRELKETQAQLVQSSKLAALGELAGALAHEINSPLLGIATFADLLARDFDNHHAPSDAHLGQWRSYVENIRIGAEECRTLASNLLSFARRPLFEFEPVDVSEVVARAIELVRKKVEAQGTELEVDVPERLDVHGDAVQLGQVIVNLVLNAAYALSEGGRITIRATREEGEVRLTVADDGPGIRREHLERIFEPFFTTKPRGEGTGLGLSISAGIAEDHRGRLEVDSKPGRGARFTLRVPALGG